MFGKYKNERDKNNFSLNLEVHVSQYSFSYIFINIFKGNTNSFNNKKNGPPHTQEEEQQWRTEVFMTRYRNNFLPKKQIKITFYPIFIKRKKSGGHYHNKKDVKPFCSKVSATPNAAKKLIY